MQTLAFLGTSALSWMVLRGLLGGVNTSSTGTGRIWRAVLFVFRLLVCMLAAEHVWKEGQREFECNVRQPGCADVCFDYFFPISQVRLRALQLIVVSMPSLLAALHVAHRAGREGKQRRRLRVGPGAVGAGLWCSPLSSLVVRTGLETGVLALLYKLCGGFRVPRVLRCDVEPCPALWTALSPDPRRRPFAPSSWRGFVPVRCAERH